MHIELDIIKGLEEELRILVLRATKDAIEQTEKKSLFGEWMNLKQGANYAGVSFNTFSKYRLLGLKVFEINGVKRVSKKEIDEFLESNSY